MSERSYTQDDVDTALTVAELPDRASDWALQVLAEEVNSSRAASRLESFDRQAVRELLAADGAWRSACGEYYDVANAEAARARLEQAIDRVRGSADALIQAAALRNGKMAKSKGGWESGVARERHEGRCDAGTIYKQSDITQLIGCRDLLDTIISNCNTKIHFGKHQ